MSPEEKSELTKTAPHLGDGFDTFEAGVEGAAERPSAQVIQGTLLKFTNEATWVSRDGAEMPDTLELVAIDVGRIVQRWKDKQPIETIVLEPGQRFPDIEKLNTAAPQSEWTTAPSGKPQGPWQSQHVVYLLDPATMGKYSFPTGTTGGAIAVADLVDRTKWMRRFRGTNVFPVVTLSDVFMNTRWNGRQRPHFLIKRWITFGDAALPAVTAPALAGPTPAAAAPPSTTKETLDPHAALLQPVEPAAEVETTPTTATTAAATPKTVEPAAVKEVEPVGAREATGDAIPF
jgi:hypothetical protein